MGSIAPLIDLGIHLATFRLRAYVAQPRDVYWERLALCVGHEFRDIKRFSGIMRHLQQQPGYACEGDVRQSEICWEAPVCITVYVDDVPQIGMGVYLSGPNLVIQQLQGVPGAKLFGELADWPKRFVTGAMLFLLNTEELDTLRIVRANRIYSYRYPYIPGGGDRATRVAIRERMRARYDGLAVSLGFTPVSQRYYEWVPKRFA